MKPLPSTLPRDPEATPWGTGNATCSSKTFDQILVACGGFGKQQKILFGIQCVLSIFYAFVLFGPMFLSLTPPDHWCAPGPEEHDLLLRRMWHEEGLGEPGGQGRTEKRRGTEEWSLRHTRRDAANERFLSAESVEYSDTVFNLIDKYPNKGLSNTTQFESKSSELSSSAYLMREEPEVLSEAEISVSNYDGQERIVSDNSVQADSLPYNVDRFLKLHYIRRLTIPRTADDSKFEQCKMYDVNWAKVLADNQTVVPDPSWPTKDCSQGWDYDFSLYYPSISSELNWVCGAAGAVPLSQAVFFLGSLVGGPLFGWLADARGRRFAFIASNLLVGVAGCFAALATGVGSFSAALFVLGFNAYPQINILYILVMEFAPSSHRAFVAAVPFMGFLTLGFTALPWLAYLAADWRRLAIILYGPLLATPFCWRLVPESVRWQVGKGDVAAARSTLHRVARVNGVKQTASLDKDLQVFLNHQKPTKNVSVLALLKLPRLRRHFIALCILLVSIRLLYDAHVRITQAIDYNLFVTFSVASALEVFSGLAAYIMADRVGRRSTIVAMFFTSSAIEGVRVVMAGVWQPYSELALHFLGKLFITTAFNIAFMFPVEVLPTVARSSAGGVIHTLGFAVSFVSPYIVYLAEDCRGCALSVLACVALVGGVTCLLLLPETRGIDLPDTLAEGEELGRGQPRGCCGRRRRKAEDTVV